MHIAYSDVPSQACLPFDIGTIGAILEEPISIQIDFIRSDERLIRKLASVLENQLLAVLEAHHVSEFIDVRLKTWPKYVRAHRALLDTLRNLSSEANIEIISKASTAIVMADLQTQRGVRFGDVLTDQAAFTLWTFSKIMTLARKVQDAEAPRDKDADLKLSSEFQVSLLWAQFNLDIMVAAMKFKKDIASDIQQLICDGLRASVNAYAILKEALALRVPPREASLTTPLPWDDEDEQLLASSMKDVHANSD